MSAGLYLHIPFCEHKCIYCDFYSIESMDRTGIFVRRLKEEIVSYGAGAKGERFSTIFFGGGTPSLLEPAVIGEILDLLASTYSIEPSAEITLESNPGTVTPEKLRGYRSAGINRLSFGIQSFHDDDLRFLTRIHTSEQAIEGFKMARRAGFGNINLDFIFALPNQTMARWEKNLRQAVALAPEHISAYSLIVEPKTPLFRMVRAGRVSPLPIETEAELYEFTMEFLHAAGYEHYEVSNYARPGFRSKHNSGYWNHSGYLGFGPSAHSFRGNRRWWNVSNLRTYCDSIGQGKLPVAGEEFLIPEQLFDEAVMLGLRGEGLDLGQLRSRYGVDLLANNAGEIERFEGDGLMLVEGERLRLTDKGYLLCDEICELLLVKTGQGSKPLRIGGISSILTPNNDNRGSETLVLSA
jgi:oxygen-independent coproporphyrinogen-3 oxidase